MTCLQKHHHSADARSWSHSHRRCRNVVLPVQIMRHQQAQRFTRHQGHHRPRWKSHHAEDPRTSLRDLSLYLEKGQSSRRMI
jgi:hypothetical protein